MDTNRRVADVARLEVAHRRLRSDRYSWQGIEFGTNYELAQAVIDRHNDNVEAAIRWVSEVEMERDAAIAEKESCRTEMLQLQQSVTAAQQGENAAMEQLEAALNDRAAAIAEVAELKAELHAKGDKVEALSDELAMAREANASLRNDLETTAALIADERLAFGEERKKLIAEYEGQAKEHRAKLAEVTRSAGHALNGHDAALDLVARLSDHVGYYRWYLDTAVPSMPAVPGLTAVDGRLVVTRSGEQLEIGGQPVFRIRSHEAVADGTVVLSTKELDVLLDYIDGIDSDSDGDGDAGN